MSGKLSASAQKNLDDGLDFRIVIQNCVLQGWINAPDRYSVHTGVESPEAKSVTRVSRYWQP